MSLNEADTRAQLIDPKLNVAGWTRSQVTREHYDRTDWVYTAGKIVLRGDRAERLPPKRVDYLLRYTDSLPIAVVEAKEEGKPGLLLDENAKRPSLHREIYFAIYQTLWNEDGRGKRLFEKFPADFFDLIIIDEAHRSGFGTWKEILDTFSGAIHFGMTELQRRLYADAA